MRSASFSLVDGVSLIGGFAGAETSIDQRIVIGGQFQNETILSGDLGTVDDTADNAYTVVYCGENVAATVDAISITGGNADGSYVFGHYERLCGGGIYSSGTLTVTNSTLSGNSANYGGGIENRSTLTLTNSTLSGNSAMDIRGNSALGGGIRNLGTMTLTNSTLSGNVATAGINSQGGGIWSTTMTLINSTVSGNSAIQGGGIFKSTNPSTLTLTNSIVAGNSNEISGLYTNQSSLIGVDPGFVRNPSDGGDGWADDPSTEDIDESANNDYGDLRLAPSSFAINMGDGSLLPPDALDLDHDGNTSEPLPVDLDGNRRVVEGTVDLGAFEFQGAPAAFETPSTVVTMLADTLNRTDGLVSLREAVVYATLGGLATAVTFDASLTGGTISLDGWELWLDGDVHIDASTIGGVILDAGGRSRVIGVHGGSVVDLASLHITGGEVYSPFSDGGGIYNDSTLTLTNSTLSGNSATGSYSDGGGISNLGTMTLTNSTLSGNSATGTYGSSSCGGIHNLGTMTLTNSTLSGNSATGTYGDGGGIWNLGTMTLTNSTLSGNSATGTYGDGGGISNRGRMTLTNSTLSGNNSPYGYGDGIYNSGTMTLTNSTLSGNSPTYSGGEGIYNSSGTLTVNNSILWQNEGSGIQGSSWSGASNLIGVDPLFVRNPSPGGDGTWGTEDDDYGDLHLTDDSPAIDAGDDGLAVDGGGLSLVTDLDGNPRIQGNAVDAGAYEALSFTLSQRRFVQGTVDVGIGMFPGGTVVRLYALAGEAQVEIGSGSAEVNDFVWDSTGVSDGRVTLLAEWFDAQGKVVHAGSRQVIVANDVGFEIHRENIGGNTTWAAGVHVVTEKLDVASGTALTIEAGAVVKFCDRTGLNVVDGATLTAADDVVFTHIADDTAGGDTNLDAGATAPRHDQYFLTGPGTISLGDSELRYLTQEYSGTLSVSQLWTARQVIRVTGDVVVPSGVRLDIEPGAIIKFDPGTSLTVQSGGEFNAAGTLARPIVFTSIHDDAHGGDTNRNDESTQPVPGDWVAVRNDGGTIVLDHTKLFYGGWAVNIPHHDNPVGMLQNTSGVATVSNSEFAHSLERLIDGQTGTVTVSNSILRDARMGVYNTNGNGGSYADVFTVANSVIYNCTAAFGGWSRGAAVRNSAIVGAEFLSWRFISGGSTVPSDFEYCAFWNALSSSSGPGNFSADPLFRDPENGDFTLRPGSPLIDAGDGSVAPTTDFFGNPRFDDPWVDNLGTPDADGAYVDIGAFEMVEGADSELDLAIGWVLAPTQATVGDTVELRWQVVNTGVKAIDGTWRDSVSLVSDAGQVVTIGDVQRQTSIGVGETIECSAWVAIPAINEGNWRFRMQLNSYRDVFEGSNIYNNAALGEGYCTITAPDFPIAGGISGQAVSDTEPQLYKLTLPAGQSLLLAGNASEPVTITASEGFAPADNSFDWQASTYGDNQYSLSIPASSEERTIYVRISTPRPDATFNLTASFDVFSLDAVSASEISNTGPSTLTLTVTGAGFESGMTFSLQRGSDTPIPGEVFDIPSGSSASVRFDMTGVPTGVYDLSATTADAARTETLTGAITVIDGISEALEASLDIPDTVREGRVYMGYVDYANTGDCDMLAPVFYVESNTGTLFAASTGELDDAVASLPLLGVSPTSPVGVLKPGESSRVPFYFVAGEETNVKLMSLAEKGDAIDSEHWTTWQEYQQAICDAATRLALRGQRDVSYFEAHLLAAKTAAGENVCAISGHLRNSQTGEPFQYATVQGVYQSEGKDYIADALTDENGYFQLAWLPPNTTITLQAAGNYYDLSQDSFALVDGEDITDLLLNAQSYSRSISGSILTELGEPICHAFVVAEMGDVGWWYAETDENGYYHINHLMEGEYTVFVNSLGVYSGTTEENVILDTSQTSLKLDITLAQAAAIRGEITESSTGEPAAFLDVLAVNDITKVYYHTLADEAGRYIVPGLPSGEWRLLVYSDQSEQALYEAPALATFVGSETEHNISVEVPVVQVSGAALDLGQVPQYMAVGLSSSDAGADNCKDLLSKGGFYRRPLAGLPSFTNLGVDYSPADRDNLRIGHEHFFDPATAYNTGYDDTNGIFTETLTGEYIPVYSDQEYYSEILKVAEQNLKATGNWNADDYVLGALPWNWDERHNCQDYADALRDEYHRISREEYRKLRERYDNCPPSEDPPEDPPQEEEDEKAPETPQSCDPNEISGPLGYDTPEDVAAMEAWRLEHHAQGHLCDDLCLPAPPLHHWMQPGGRMEYTVYFENLASATAAAQEVFVDHQLDENLDWSTFAMQEVVFNNQIVDAVDGTAAGSVTVDDAGTSYQVMIDTSIDHATGEIDWYLRSFDPSTFDNWPSDPYAGFLPPNDATHRGEGHITFSVVLNDGLQTGDAIHSEAEIVFDYNEPIVTDPSWTNTIDIAMPASSVNALPADSPATFVVSWAGTDEGSGIANYTTNLKQR